MSSPEAELVEWAAKFTHDPLGFVMFAFPWGSGELADHDGPDVWQREMLEDIGAKLRAGGEFGAVVQEALASGHGVGKALAHGEPVLTPHGWRPIESLRVGDLVISADGTATEVIGVFPQGERDVFRVTLDDGCSVVTDGDHQWLTNSRSERKHGKPGSVRTTREIAASLTFANGPAIGLNHQLPALSAVQHPHADLPIEPYLFGCWLGDGDASGRITGMQEGFDALVDAGADLGVVISKTGTEAVTRSALGIRPLLRAIGLYGCRAHEKSIPEIYLRADISQRIALLQGLMDTDGSGNGNGALTFEVTAPGLADGMAELVRSLGGVVRRSEKVGAYGGKECRRVYRLFISLPRGIEPFRIPRKAAMYQPEWGSKNCDRTRRRHIANVEWVGRSLATCIAVAHPSKLFVTRDHIVTHNSAFVSWIIEWAMTTHEDTRGVVTANTESQLKTKTWAELAKWHRLCIFGHWFEFTATKLSAKDPKHADTWRIDMVPWSEQKTEAFAGLHNQGKRVLLVFDEASAIPDAIWEVSEGALTDANTEIIWCVFGNPTRNTGRFRECFGVRKHRWAHKQVDSRTVKITNKAQIAQWVADYGEDSDFVRVRVRGVFPRAGSTQFIGSDIVEAAASCEARAGIYDPLVLGVDPARFGDDESVIYIRKGRDGRTHPPLKFRGLDNMQLAARVAEQYEFFRADAIFVDGGGVGAGVVDRLRQLRIPVIEVQFGASADRSNPGQEGTAYSNKGAEMWGVMREWLATGGAIPDDNDLKSQLQDREYGYVLKDGRDAIQLESKKDMKKRGLSSPDIADGLALTFAYPVQPNRNAGRAAAFTRPLVEHEYDPFANHA